MPSRRNFLKSSAITLSASNIYPFLRQTDRFALDKRFSDAAPLQMGMAGYTFHHFNIDDSIEMMKRVAISSLSIKDFHLPLDSPPEKIDEIMGKFRSSGIIIYAAGVIYMKTPAEADQAFQYAKNIGVNLIIGAPDYDLLPYVEQKVKSSNIRLAIHNHGPEDKLYPGPKDIYERIKNADPGVGICLDIGHAVRAGVDPAKAVRDFAPRILDMHVKDVSEAAPGGKAVEVGRGVINFPDLVSSLIKIKYAGKCSLEFEQEVKDPLPGIAESEGFFRGVMKALSPNT
jgi:inosose dehydratase